MKEEARNGSRFSEERVSIEREERDGKFKKGNEEKKEETEILSRAQERKFWWLSSLLP